jgi:hypothetical protein
MAEFHIGIVFFHSGSAPSVVRAGARARRLLLLRSDDDAVMTLRKTPIPLFCALLLDLSS